MLLGPIFSREVLTTPRRRRHFVLRGCYVAFLFVVMWAAWQAIIGFHVIQRIGDIASFNYYLFQIFAYTQLALIMFFGSLYGASSISYEKDRRTFVLLLMTRLPDHEIVVNKFQCVVLQVGGAMLTALPAFMITGLMGGVSFFQIAQIYAVTAGAALVSGAVGVLIASWREQTYQSVTMTMLAVVLALLVIEATATYADRAYPDNHDLSMWCVCMSPIRAMTAAVGVGPGASGAIPIFRNPSWAYLALTVAASVVYLTVAIVKLRAWNPRSEPIQQPEEDSDADRSDAEGRSTKKRSRRIWDNPVLWREMKTRAYGTKPVLVKVGYGIVFAVILAGLLTMDVSLADRRLHLWAAVFVMPLGILSLLLMNTQAVTAITSERDLRSIDLLLATDISAKEFVYGKLAGILYNTREMVAVPLVLIALCTARGMINSLGLIYVCVCFLIFVAFATVLGIHAGLRYTSTVASIANSLGTIFLLSMGIGLCLGLIVISGRVGFEAQWASFVFFIVLGSIGLWVSLSANAPSNAIGLASTLMPFFTFYCIIAFLQGQRTLPFLVGTGVYGFAVMALLVPLVSEFDVATGRTTAEEG